MPAGDEFKALRVQTIHNGKHAASERFPVDDPEPHLNDMQPQPRHWGTTSMEPRELLQLGLHIRPLTGLPNIQQELQLKLRIRPIQLTQQGEKLLPS